MPYAPFRWIDRNSATMRAVVYESGSRTRRPPRGNANRKRGRVHMTERSGITRGGHSGETSWPSRTTWSATKLMSALRLVTSAARRAPRNFALGRRGYAEAADKINLSLVLPHQVRLPATTASPFLYIIAGFLTGSCTRLNRPFSLPRMLCK